MFKFSFASIVAGLLFSAVSSQAATLEAVSARPNGTIISKTAGVAGVLQRGVGRYQVRFKGSPEKCIYTATVNSVGDPFDVEGQDRTGRFPYFIQTAWTPNSTGITGDLSKSVFVIIHNRAGALESKGFGLHVVCP